FDVLLMPFPASSPPELRERPRVWVRPADRLGLPATPGATVGTDIRRSPPAPGPQPQPGVRPRVAGKFLFAGQEKLLVRGVTYGTFEANFPHPARVASDFASMVAHGINAVRTYTTPPRWLLDLAQQHGLWVLAGLAWEQHVAFLDEPDRLRGIECELRAGVRDVAAHAALVGFVVGNEIPASVVRWLGRSRVERFLSRAYRAVRSEDPGSLITYAGYP